MTPCVDCVRSDRGAQPPLRAGIDLVVIDEVIATTSAGGRIGLNVVCAVLPLAWKRRGAGVGAAVRAGNVDLLGQESDRQVGAYARVCRLASLVWILRGPER